MSIITDINNWDAWSTVRNAINDNFDNLNTDKLEQTDLADYETSTQLNARDTANRARANHTGTQSADTIVDWTLNKVFTTWEKTKLAWIEDWAEANNISDSNATDLTDAWDTVLHFHNSDRDRVNHTGNATTTYTDFTPWSLPSEIEGRHFYDQAEHAMSYYTDISWFYVRNGRDLLARVKNETWDTLTKWTIVYVVSATWWVASVDKANAKNYEKSRLVWALQTDVLNWEETFAAVFWQINWVNTASYANGTILYLSTDWSWQWTDARPDDWAFLVIVWYVYLSDAVNWVVWVYPKSTELAVEVTDTNGFPSDQRTNTTISVDDLTTTFTISPTGADFHYYELWNKYEQVGSDSKIFTDQEGEHWFYYNNWILTVQYNPSDIQKEDIILNHAFIASIYRNATDKKVEFDVFDERHGISMSPATHVYLHLTRWAQYFSWYWLWDLTVDWGWSLNTDAQFSVAPWSYFDEDIEHTESGIVIGGTTPVGYLVWTWADFRVDTQTNFAVLNAPAWRLYYNQLNVDTWQLTEVTNGNFVLYHIFAINWATKNTISIMWQNEYWTIATARAWATSEITNILTGFDLNEVVPIATLIYQTQNTYANAVKARIRSTDEWDDYIDWRVTELAQWTAATSHLNLTNVQLAGLWVAQWHIDDQAQELYWIKTFNSSPIIPTPTTDFQAATKKYVDDNAWWTDVNAIHVNEASEISWINTKATPSSWDFLVIEDVDDSNNKKKITIWSLPTGWGWEANTASNVWVAWVWVFKQKTWVNLEFKNIHANSSKIAVTDDVPNNEIDIDIVESEIDHQNLNWAWTNTHAQIDTHIAATAAHWVSGNIVWTTDSQTLTTKTINLANNTLTWTTAQFNAALSDGSFATGWWTATWTNTWDQTSIVWITWTKAQFDTAVTDGNIVYVWDDITGKSASTDALNSATTTVNVSSATAPTTGQVLTATSWTAATWQTPAWWGGVDIMMIQDQKTSGSDAGWLPTVDAWNTRDLNTILENWISWASLSSNVITLPAWTYRINFTAPWFDCNEMQTRLQNTTDTTTAVIWSSTLSDSTDPSTVTSIWFWYFTIASSKNFEMQTNIDALAWDASETLWREAARGINEVYSQILIEKIS